MTLRNFFSMASSLESGRAEENGRWVVHRAGAAAKGAVEAAAAVVARRRKDNICGLVEDFKIDESEGEGEGEFEITV